MRYLNGWVTPLGGGILCLILIACGSDHSANFAGGKNGKNAVPDSSSEDANANTDETNGTVGNDSDTAGNGPRTPTDGQTTLGDNDTNGGNDGDEDEDANDSDNDTGDKEDDDTMVIDAGEVVASCANASKLQTITRTITFEPQKDCTWGTKDDDGNMIPSANGNWPIRNTYIQAREDQSRKVAMPENSIICGANLTSETNEIHFDDYYAIRLNDVVLASSRVLVDALTPQDNGLFKWDWETIRGTKFDDNGYYCMAGDGSCQLPEHDQSGDLSLNLSLDDANADSPQAKLFAMLSGASELDFVATATGDDDGKDCDHSGGTFNLTLTYLGK